jgi:branched-subunit amino acid ABC-type transport system permease component
MALIHVIIQGVLLGGLYALFAAGLSLIFGVMRLVNIAHGDLIVVAAYMAYFTMQALGVGPFTSLIVVVPAIAVFGYALQRGLLNFALGDELPPLLVTFACRSSSRMYCSSCSRTTAAGSMPGQSRWRAGSSRRISRSACFR